MTTHLSSSTLITSTQYYSTIPTANAQYYSTTSTTLCNPSNVTYDSNSYSIIHGEIGVDLKLSPGNNFQLPNGYELIIDKLGNFEIKKPDDQKIIYKACTIREFNKYVNASDLLEEFILFLGEKGVKQKDVLNTPVELFITWLVYKAAIQDHLDDNEIVNKLEHKTKNVIYHRCKFCGRFISQKLVDIGINFCNEVHMRKHMQKQLA